MSQPVRTLDPELVVRLRSAPLTYPEQGCSRNRQAPPGFRALSGAAVLPAGSELDTAADQLLRWQVQRRAGFQVAVSAPRIETGAVALLSAGIGPLAIRSPVRVVYVIDEPDRRGFAYGTLAGHPESGEEAFVLQRDPAGQITFSLSAYSRPGTWWSRALHPAVTAAQHLITSRYLHAFD